MKGLMHSSESKLESKKRMPAVLVLAFWTATGCATLSQSMEAPDVSIAGLRIVDANLAQQTYELTLNVNNPNPVALPVRGIAYRIELGGEEFASGSTLRAFTVPAGGESDFAVTISTDLVRSFAGLQRLISNGEQVFAYKIGGELQVNLPLVKALPFATTGEIDLTSAYRY